MPRGLGDWKLHSMGRPTEGGLGDVGDRRSHAYPFAFLGFPLPSFDFPSAWLSF